MTEGEERVRENKTDPKMVKKFKRRAAALIDMIDSFSDQNATPDLRRNCASAMTAIEEAVMWTTKAMTSRDAALQEPEDDEADEPEAEPTVDQDVTPVSQATAAPEVPRISTRGELEAMTKDELVEYAGEQDIEVAHSWTKHDLVSAILKGEQKRARTAAG